MLDLEKVFLIGIDGGATEVKAHHIEVISGDPMPDFKLGDLKASRKYKKIEGFHPIAVPTQLTERTSNNIKLGKWEKMQGEEYIKSTFECIEELVSDKATPLLIGMGMPGLKTDDLRGINVINNGARIPDFLTQLEGKISEAGYTLASPIARLGSDADYCGLGEEYASDGLFKDVANAYYCGGGTGIADALKLKGEIVPLDKTKNWLHKSWQIISSIGLTYEKMVSASALCNTFANLSKTDWSELLSQERFPQEAAADGDPTAIALVQFVGAILGELLFERLTTIKKGREELEYRGTAYATLKTNHEFTGTILDRVILGQRIGFIYAEPKYEKVFKKPVDNCLAWWIKNYGDDEMKSSYLDGDKIKDNLIVSSKLRAAPAIGAAVDAVRALNGN